MAKKSTRSKANIPKDESKGDRFVRVVTSRVGKAVKAIKMIGYCSGSTYESTAKQQDAIYRALVEAVNDVNDRFKSKTEPTADFTFPD